MSKIPQTTKAISDIGSLIISPIISERIELPTINLALRRKSDLLSIGEGMEIKSRQSA